MKKLLYISFIFSALFLFASCDRNMVTYESPAGNPLVSFYSDAAVFAMLLIFCASCTDCYVTEQI